MEMQRFYKEICSAPEDYPNRDDSLIYDFWPKFRFPDQANLIQALQYMIVDQANQKLWVSELTNNETSGLQKSCLC